MFAAQTDALRVVQTLLRHGANPQLRDKERHWTAEHTLSIWDGTDGSSAANRMSAPISFFSVEESAHSTYSFPKSHCSKPVFCGYPSPDRNPTACPTSNKTGETAHGGQELGMRGGGTGNLLEGKTSFSNLPSRYVTTRTAAPLPSYGDTTARRRIHRSHSRACACEAGRMLCGIRHFLPAVAHRRRIDPVPSATRFMDDFRCASGRQCRGGVSFSAGEVG